MTPPKIAYRCPHCGQRRPLRNPRLVTCTTHHNDVTWWRGTCPNRQCRHIITSLVTQQTARAYAAAFPTSHIVIPPPLELLDAARDNDDWTVDHLKEMWRLYREATTDEIWGELDRHLHGTDSGIIDWGDE